jgi:hypothetical protein
MIGAKEMSRILSYSSSQLSERVVIRATEKHRLNVHPSL